MLCIRKKFIVRLIIFQKTITNRIIKLYSQYCQYISILPILWFYYVHLLQVFSCSYSAVLEERKFNLIQKVKLFQILVFKAISHISLSINLSQILVFTLTITSTMNKRLIVVNPQQTLKQILLKTLSSNNLHLLKSLIILV